MSRAASVLMIGLRPETGGLRVDPCIPLGALAPVVRVVAVMGA